MGTEPSTARARAAELSRGLDPDALSNDSLGADIARAASPPPTQKP
jgi:hypothetical protein